MSARVTLYGKPGCHLCFDAFQALLRVQREIPFDLDEVDVSVDPGLHSRYGERIPVVTLEGEELFEYHVNPAVLRERLGRVGS